MYLAINLSVGNDLRINELSTVFPIFPSFPFVRYCQLCASENVCVQYGYINQQPKDAPQDRTRLTVCKKALTEAEVIKQT